MTRTEAAIAPAVDQPFRVEEIALDAPRADEVRVRMVATGLCHTDLSVRAGRTPLPLPAVLGHEGAGVVEDVGAEVNDVRPGDRVLLSFTSCQSCRECLRGHPASCHEWAPRNLLSGQRSDGTSPVRWRGESVSAAFFGQSSFARQAIVQRPSLIVVDDDTPLPELAPLGCAVQTGVGTVVNVLRPEPGSTLVVYGAGAVGLAAVMGAALGDLERLIVVDRVAERLDLSGELGATDVVNASTDDPGAAIADLTNGRGVDYAIEATGNVSVLENAVSALATSGTLAVVGAPAAGTVLPVDVKHLVRGRRLVGVTEGDSDPPRFIPELMRMYRDGALPIDRLITYYPFEDIERAADDAIAGRVVKPVLLFDQTPNEERT